MRYLIFVFLLVISSHSFGQSLKIGSLIENYGNDGKIEGVVLDGENEGDPLFFAEILVKEAGISVVTDVDGAFKLSLNPGNYTLVFSFIGYQTIEVEDVEVLENTTLKLDQVLGALRLKTTISIAEINTI
ncbi:carboxypeptidase-like regulatory domain-containing protein [Lutibacter sp. A80]|uniref:carboxypeptidase-like regulatory domain-containing protein n=1 Tax=Lutibacter sp. A80 TaxID=2918453 RepID=UPI001F05E625|nr:carboxypeptidase-like regulatory domain-containing protein [Lutibacter sp. A80]UMB59802.1 carboxypeptidase-like regulatory domain-containing protein [Lutibacter sp. A80]